jgi:cation:H+ antiporter
VRLGAIDLAVGNIFGSNVFNMTVLLMMEIAHRGKPLLASVSPSHVVSSFAAVMATALGVMAILARTHKQAWVTRMIASLIVVVYGVSFYLLARTG